VHRDAITPPAGQSGWTTSLSDRAFTAPQDLTQVLSSTLNAAKPPSFLVPIYKAAGSRYHIPWQILAAINGIETDYGRDLAVSAAGAIGWMQFMPSTWMAYGLAADGGARRPDPYDPQDAIFSAARYLAANGGSRDLRRALFAYNHAIWYVDAVLLRAQMISDPAPAETAQRTRYMLLLDVPPMHRLGSIDHAFNIGRPPDRFPGQSPAAHRLTAVPAEPSGVGLTYPLFVVTAIALASWERRRTPWPWAHLPRLAAFPAARE
jgi:hypothetical protein